MAGIAYESVGKDVNGRYAILDTVAAKWWRLVKEMLSRELPGVAQYIIQARGTYKGSGGTHSDGAAIDLRTWHMSKAQILKVVAVMRRYGGVAWYRTNVGSGPHIHVAINLVRWTKCTYQVVAAKKGRDGLGAGGRKHPDPHPAPAEWITAEEGIRRMEKDLGEDELDVDEKTFKAWVSEAVANGITYGNRTLGGLLKDVDMNAAAAAANTASIRRPSDPKADSNGNKSLRQELADALTEVRDLAHGLASIQAEVQAVRAQVNELTVK